MSKCIDTEICVIGGGPAGAATALRLAQLGQQVCLLEQAAFPRAHVGESLPASIWPILHMLDLAEPVAKAGFLRSTGSVLHWGGSFERRGPGDGAAGLLVDRGRFDALVLDAARAVGVRVLQPARGYRPKRCSDGWLIPVTTDSTITVNTRVLIDAAGRQAGLGRRFRPASQSLLALYAYWSAPVGFGAQARVEAGAAHWYWGALLPGEVINAMIFVDPSCCTGLSPADRRDLYLNLLAQSTLLSPCLEQRRIGPVRRCDATSLVETTAPAPDLLRVGEASFSVDPLSSQGVQMAMGQAVQTATVVNTVLTRPEHIDLALGFYQDRKMERVCAHAGLSADFYARQQQVTPASFWAERAQPLPDFLSPTIAPRDGAPTPDQTLQLCEQAGLMMSGVQTATHIEPELVLQHPNLPRPVANMQGIALAPLIGQLKAAMPAREIVALWSRSAGHDRALAILRWLWQNRVLTG